MTLDRAQIETLYAVYRKHLDAGDGNAWADLFSEDCSVVMPGWSA